jgi:hypothetical protein
MNLKTTAKAKGPMPNKRAKYPSRSTAAKTKMLTVCKKCRTNNDNGYQYCTTCHKAHKGSTGRKVANPGVQVPPIDPDEVLKVANPAVQVRPVDPDEVLKVAATEL